MRCVRATGPVPAAVPLLASLLLALSLAGCAPRVRPGALPLPGAAGWSQALRRTCPGAVAASVRIRLEPREGPGATIDGTLRAILPDTLALSARLGVFRPFFALRADADSAELLLHEARRFWVAARADEDWSLLNPSAWARALAWALCPADLVDRLIGPEPAGGDEKVYRMRGRLRDSPYLAELEFERRSLRLAGVRLLDDTALVLELRQRAFRRSGDAWIPGVVELRLPGNELSVRVEVIGVSTARFDRPPAVDRLRPAGWLSLEPGQPYFSLPGPGQDPG